MAAAALDNFLGPAGPSVSYKHFLKKVFCSVIYKGTHGEVTVVSICPKGNWNYDVLFSVDGV